MGKRVQGDVTININGRSVFSDNKAIRLLIGVGIVAGILALLYLLFANVIFPILGFVLLLLWMALSALTLRKSFAKPITTGYPADKTYYEARAEMSRARGEKKATAAREEENDGMALAGVFIAYVLILINSYFFAVDPQFHRSPVNVIGFVATLSVLAMLVYLVWIGTVRIPAFAKGPAPRLPLWARALQIFCGVMGILYPTCILGVRFGVL